MNELCPFTNTSQAVVMCWKCQEIDARITHYQTLGKRVTDPATLKGLGQLIDELRDEKKALHSEREEK